MGSLISKVHPAKLKQIWWLARGGVGRDPVAYADDELPPDELRKTDILLQLIGYFGFKAYLELCSDCSGNYYRTIRDSGIEARRLMYRIPRFKSDGMRIDYRSTSLDIAQPLARLARDGYRPDICLVDSWHDYETSLRDIRAAYDLLAEGGAMVVHDCLPPTLEMALPERTGGCWCGYSHRAFIDFVWSTPGCAFFTVDCDFGCGVIVKGRAGVPLAGESLAARDMLSQWGKLASDPSASFAFLEHHKQALLNLVSAEDFLEAFSFSACNGGYSEGRSFADMAMPD